MNLAKYTEDNERILTEIEQVKFGISRTRAECFEMSRNDVNNGAWKPAPKTKKKKGK